MNDTIVNRVESFSSGTANTALNRVRDITFPIDAPAHHGGTPKNVTPADAFLAGICACGVLLVEGHAADTGAPLTHAAFNLEATRNVADPSIFTKIDIIATLSGVDQTTAERLVEYYRDG